MKKAGIKIAVLALMAAGLIGCDNLGIGPSPQAAIVPDAVRPVERSAEEASRPETALEVAQRIQLMILGEEQDEAFAGFGFLPGSSAVYAAYQDGNASHISAQGQLTKMDVIVDRLDGAILAGSDRRRIVGTAFRGSSMSWNTENLTQQLILRPQVTTFEQVRNADMVWVRRAPYVAVAAEPNRLEMWSLISGDLAWSGTFEGLRPRVIMPGGLSRNVVFGTESGDVRVWSGGNTSRKLYEHEGPVLSLERIPQKNAILSTGRDGQVLLYSRTSGEVVARMPFARAVYGADLSNDGQYLVVRPSQGYPRYLNLETGRDRMIFLRNTSRTTDGAFAADDHYYVFLSRNGFVTAWDLANEHSAYIIAPSTNRKVDYMAVQQNRDWLLLVTQDNQVEVWDAVTGEYLFTPFQSTIDIAGIALNSAGTHVLLPLADGRLVRFRLSEAAHDTLVGP